MNDFMKDRYGVDELTATLGCVGLILALVGTLMDVDPLSWGSIAVMTVALLRALSKNIKARSAENSKFVKTASKIPVLQSIIEKMGLSDSRSSNEHARETANNARGRDERKTYRERNKRIAKQMWQKRKTSRFLKCPACGQILSVPKNKGRIRVTCPHCHAKMETKS